MQKKDKISNMDRQIKKERQEETEKERGEICDSQQFS